MSNGTLDNDHDHHTFSNGNDLIEYDGNFGNSFKTKHHYFFFEGKKELIDVENEWFLDQDNERLYVFPQNSVDLNNNSVRGKVRDYSVLIDNSSHITIEGLTFFATTFKAVFQFFRFALKGDGCPGFCF